MAEGHGLSTRLAEVLAEHDLPVRSVAELSEPPVGGMGTVVTGPLAHGFVADAIKLALFTAGDLSGQRAADKATRKMPARRKNQIDPLELTPGDPVVHAQHGVGRYREMVQRTVAGATREYLVIEYAPSKRGQPADRLYVPMDALDQVTRYVGGENPTLDKMGGADWAKRKGRARKAVREIAAELIQLYAARQATRGHAFSPDTAWQRELEDAFSYVETPDQLAAVEEVKRDMEQVVPMDRLICGDVGYGKTEIAVRAAFKAVQDGKQVAILVPTTLLVQQHHATFADRYAGFPINVAPLSRFQSEAEVQGHPGRPQGWPGRCRGRYPPAALPGGRRSKTSAWWSSTRSSGSGSSTRNSSNGCGPRSTCWPCRPRPSRALWRWPSPASAR